MQQMMTHGHFLPCQKQVLEFTSLENVISACILRELRDVCMFVGRWAGDSGFAVGVEAGCVCV